MPKTTNPTRDREPDRKKTDGGRAHRDIHDERAPAAPGREGAGEAAVSLADGVLDPSVNESSRH